MIANILSYARMIEHLIIQNCREILIDINLRSCDNDLMIYENTTINIMMLFIIIITQFDFAYAISHA